MVGLFCQVVVNHENGSRALPVVSIYNLITKVYRLFCLLNASIPVCTGFSNSIAFVLGLFDVVPTVVCNYVKRIHQGLVRLNWADCWKKWYYICTGSSVKKTVKEEIEREESRTAAMSSVKYTSWVPSR